MVACTGDTSIFQNTFLEPPEGVTFGAIYGQGESGCAITNSGSLICVGQVETTRGTEVDINFYHSVSIAHAHKFGCAIVNEGGKAYFQSNTFIQRLPSLYFFYIHELLLQYH